MQPWWSKEPRSLSVERCCLTIIGILIIKILFIMKIPIPGKMAFVLKWAQDISRYDIPDSKVQGPTWDPPGSCRAQVGHMLAPWTLLSGIVFIQWAGFWLVWVWFPKLFTTSILTHDPLLTPYMMTKILVNNGSDNVLLPDGTNPLPKPMLIYLKFLCFMVFTCKQFHKKWIDREFTNLLKLIEPLDFSLVYCLTYISL